MKKVLFFLFLFFNISFSQDFFATQGIGEQGIRLSTVVGRYTYFTGAKLGYDYRYLRWLQLSAELFYEHSRIVFSYSHNVSLGFLPKFRLFSAVRDRLTMSAGIGLYGAWETIANKNAEEEKNSWLYGFSAHAELDYYISRNTVLFLAGKQFVYPNAKNGIWRPFGELGVKFSF